MREPQFSLEDYCFWQIVWLWLHPSQVKQPVWNLSLLRTAFLFSSTMAPEAIKQVYMLADTTQRNQNCGNRVYWWDITREYMANQEKKRRF